MAEITCRHFTGYKPCGKSATCGCAHFAPVRTRVLIVHLEALGAVLRSTSLLAAIHRQHPGAHVTWVTKAPAHRLLANLTEIDRVLTTDDLLPLRALAFDVAYVIDKSLAAAGVLASTTAREVRGFRAQGHAIVPANPEANELWELGLDDRRKFFENQKSEQRLTHEALALGEYRRDGYRVEFTRDEKATIAERRAAWGPSLGLNVGCSATLPAKKLTVEGHRDLIARLHARFGGVSIVLLGGPEDSERMDEIARGLDVIVSPSRLGLRDGLLSVAATDLVFSGDSLGMHMAIALKKWTVAWFGPTCAPEIDLYDRGVKILTKAPCAPCWKRDCGRTTMCYDQVDFNAVVDGLAQGMQWLTSSSKPHFPETSSSPSP